MFYVLSFAFCMVLWVVIKNINPKNMKAAENMEKGIDFLLPDGRRIVDDSIAMTIPHLLVQHVSDIFHLPRGQADVLIYHKLKDGTWIMQSGRVAFGKCLGRSFKTIDELQVRAALSTQPQQFIAAFGEPDVVK
jgi:hypothetical protein